MLGNNFGNQYMKLYWVGKYFLVNSIKKLIKYDGKY